MPHVLTIDVRKPKSAYIFLGHARLSACTRLGLLELDLSQRRRQQEHQCYWFYSRRSEDRHMAVYCEFLIKVKEDRFPDARATVNGQEYVVPLRGAGPAVL